MGRVRRTLWIGTAVVIVLIGGTVVLAQTGTQNNTTVSTTVSALPMTASMNTSLVSITAPAGELIDASTGQVLYANHVTDRYYPASLVKMMTSLLLLEQVKKGQLTMNSIIPVSQQAFQVAQTPGLSVAYINPAEHIPVWKMLEYMYVVSADDAAVAVGDALGGTETSFAHMMNQKAHQLGLTGTHYTNASGLQDPNQYTNVRDMGTLARYLISHYPIVLKYASMKGMYIHPGQYGTTYDQLLGQYPGLDGLKTGSTTQAGYNFVGTAKRGHTSLISVVLHAGSFQNVFQDTANLLNFGFAQFHQVQIRRQNQPLSQKVWVKNGSDQQVSVAPYQNIDVQVMRGKSVTVKEVLSVQQLNAPIAAGQKVGMDDIVVNGHTVLQVPVYAVKADPQAGFIAKIWRSVMNSAHLGAKHVITYLVKKLGKL